MYAYLALKSKHIWHSRPFFFCFVRLSSEPSIVRPFGHLFVFRSSSIVQRSSSSRIDQSLFHQKVVFHDIIFSIISSNDFKSNTFLTIFSFFFIEYSFLWYSISVNDLFITVANFFCFCRKLIYVDNINVIWTSKSTQFVELTFLVRKKIVVIRMFFHHHLHCDIFPLSTSPFTVFAFM